MKIARSLLLASALTMLSAIAVDLHGQALTPGSLLRLRLKGDAQPVIYGTLIRVQRDTVFLHPEYDSTYTVSTVPLRRVAQIDEYQGTHGHAKAGALIGFGIGAAAGAAAFADFSAGWGGSRGENVSSGVLGGFLGGATGAGLGALIGWVIVRGETWKPVPFTSVQVAPVSLGRVGFGLSLSF